MLQQKAFCHYGKIPPRMLGVAGLALLAAFATSAQTVRVATWDITAPATGSVEKTPGAALERSASEMKRQAPDLVLLRGVSGWKMCSQLVEALKPLDYRVLVCSAFRDASGSELSRRQVAILARKGGYFAWNEPWSLAKGSSSAGGFAFAAVQLAGHRFGFTCAEFGESQKSMSQAAARQWLETLNSFRGWSSNRLEGFVAGVWGLDLSQAETARALRAAGFSEPQSSQMGQPGEIVEGHLVPSLDATSGLVLSRWPMTCEFDFRPAPILIVAANPSLAPAPSAQAPVAASRFGSPGAVWLFAGIVAALLIVILITQVGIRRRLVRLQTQGALIPLGSSAPHLLSERAEQTSLPVAPDAAHAHEHEAMLRRGLLPHLAEWLKQTFVQRLLGDRQKLLDTQGSATMKVLAIDDRLARLETKIQEETSSYEKQIEQLNRELLTAREENLELIRSQIKQLKSEMEEARSRVIKSGAV